MQGALITVSLALATVPLGFGAGLLLALVRMSRSRPARMAGEAYTTFFRGIPDLLALFIVYFGLQTLIDRIGTLLHVEGRIELSAFLAGVIALSVVVSAYSSEVWLASFNGVPPGQAEAARSLGLSRRNTFMLVTLPQLLRVALPGMANIWSVLVKDTSLISTLAVMDLLRAASEAAKNTRDPILFYTAARCRLPGDQHRLPGRAGDAGAAASPGPRLMAGWLGFLVNLPLLQEYGWRLVIGLQVTAEVVGLSCAAGFCLAWPICFARRSRNRLVSGAALAYVTVFRGTPLLCQLYLVYYGAGEIRPFLTTLGLWTFFRDAFFCCIFAFTLNTAAYQAEIFRGAIAAVPKGQLEAAAALGLSRWRIAWHVVFPQGLLVALRPLGNELISIIKASALAAIVTVLDLMGQTRLIFSRTFDFSVYFYAALLYLAVTEIIRRVWLVIEHAWSAHLHVSARPQPELGKTVTQAPQSNLVEAR